MLLNSQSFLTNDSQQRTAKRYALTYLLNHCAKVIVGILVVFGLGGNVFGQTTPFTSSTTWTVPAGVTCITVECWGGGGGSGGAKGSSYTDVFGNSSYYSAGGGGGGGGAYSKSQVITVTPGQVLNITVGVAGSAGGNNGTTNGGAGGISSVLVGSTTYQALGGSGGGSRNSTSGNGVGTGGNGGAAETNGTLYSTMRKGGNGVAGLITGSFNFGGSGGGAGGPISDGGNAAIASGTTASVPGISGGSPSGAGGQGQKAGGIGSVTSTVGNYIGGGGGGSANAGTSSTGVAGRAGAIGEVRITVCIPTCTAPTSVSATSNSPICAGATLNLTGAATGNTSWSWLGPNNFSSTSPSPSIATATTAASGSYFLTAQNSCGTGSGLFDNFSDNNFTSNPVWTPQPNPSTGVTPTTWTSGVLNLTGANGNSEEVISTPSTQEFGSWKFDFKMGQINHANAIVSFIFISNQSTLINAQGYYVSVRGNPTTTSSTIYLRRYNGAINQGGNANNVTLASYTWSGDTNPHSLMVTRGTNGVFSLYFDNVLLGVTSPDLTYITSSFAGFFHYSSNLAINHEVDNIVCSSTLVDVTVNPTITTPTFVLGATSSRCTAANSVSYTATSTNSTGITYSLDAGSITGGVTINSATGDVTYPASWSGTTVITASAAGCGGPLTATHTVTTNPLISFANLQSPLSGQMCASGVFDVFGQVFINGVTNSAGVTSGLIAELGISSTNSNPSGAGWTWINAPFNIQVGNNDEFKGTFSGLSAGTYYYAFRYSYNGCSFVYGGATGIWSNTADNGILTVYNAPSLTVNPSTICNGATNIAIAGSGASTYELLLNGVSQGDASSTSSWTVAGPLSTGNTVCVRGYPANNLVMNGDISESFWGVPIVNSNGGPGSGFSPNRLNAIYIRNGFGFLNLAVAGRLDHDNKILIFLDIKTGGFNNLSGWTNRSNAPHNAIRNLKGDVGSSIQFDAGFFADYIVSVGVDNNGIHYLDLYDMVANTNTFIGNSSANVNRISYQANASATDFSKGYELRIPMNLLGTLSNPMQVFAMLTNNPTVGSGTFLSNQFLTRANNSQGNFGDVAINFNNEPPNPISYGLYPECYTDLCRTVTAIVTPTFNQVAAICSGGSLAALPTTSTNGITGTWAPALDNTQTTTYTFTPTAGLCASSTTMTITVNPLPSVIANSNSPFCAGQAINLTATDGFSAYAWSGPNSFSNATQNPSISNAQAINAGTYTVTVTDGNGCQATSSTVVSLTTSPTASSNSPVCVGGALTLSTNSATSYSWSGPNSFTSSFQIPTVSASATTAMAGTYTVSVIGSCGGATGVVDNFSDGNFTANPFWTEESGAWEVSSGYLRGDNTVQVDKIRTPSTQVYGTWNFDFQFKTTSGTTAQVVRVFPIATLTTLNSGYYVYIDGGGAFQLRRLDNGTPTTLINATWTPNLLWRTVKLIREFDNTFKLYLGGVLMGTSSADATYTTSTHFGIWNTGSIGSDNHYIDNISCSPPATATTTVVVNTAPSISSKTGTICSENTYTMPTASPDVVPSGTTYSWSFTANPSITGATTGTAQSSFAQTLANTSGLPQVIIYSVTPTVNGCPGTAFTVTITVDAPLNGGTVTTDQTICAGAIPTELTSTLLPSGGGGLGITGSVQIGTQYWMNSNLNVVNYNDGTPVGTDFTGTVGAYTWYDNSYPTWGQYYGALYNWYAVNTGKLCPSDWHVPTQAEWNTLINYVGNTLNAGKKLKSCRTVTYGCPTTLDPRWDADNTAFGTDDYGFAILPAGRAFISSGSLNFERVRSRTRFWASTQNDVSNGYTYEFNELSSGVTVFNHPKNEGYSVRCMGDNATTIQNSYTYQWQQDPGCTGTWTNISGANSLTYQPGALTQTTCFRRITTDACGTAYSNTITITITPGPVITAMNATICSGSVFTVTPVNGTNGIVPDGTTYTWSAPVISPASSITGGSAQATAQSSISQTLTNTTTSTATATYTVTATSGSCNYTFTVTVTVLPPIVPGTVAGISSNGGGPGHLVIYQVYGGGLSASPTYTNDFVVLYNPTSSPVNLSGWSLQYASATGSGWGTSPSPLSLSGTIQSGGYFLISLSGNASGLPIPTPDLAAGPPTITGGITVSATAGKIALLNSTVPLNGTCPTNGTIVDFVGFGTNASCFEGTGFAPTISATTWLTRALNGCQDTDVNSADFTAGNTTAPKNSASPTNFCTTTSLTETICANATASSITATAATGSTGSFTYQWYSQAGDVACPTVSSTTGWTLIPGENSLTYSPGTVSSTTTYALFITPTGAVGCTGTWATDCRKVVVNPAPIVNNMTTTICSGTAFAGTPVDVTNGTVPSGTTYTWTVAANSNVTGQSAQVTAQSSISQTLINSTTTSQTVVYTVTPSFGTCVGATFTVTVTVNPSPILSNASISACTGVAFTHTPTGSNVPSGTTYSWSSPSGSNFTGSAAGSAASTVDGTLTLSSGSSATAVYTITPALGSCSGANFTLIVNLSDCAPPTPFTACNLVVYEIGDGTTLGSSAFPVKVKEITPSGVLVQTISSLFTGTNQLTQSGSSTSTGFLNSYNGFLAVPGLNSIIGAANATDQNTKVTHIIGSNATLNTRTLHPTSGTVPFTGDNYRSVVPVSASSFYCAGTSNPTGTGGIWYYDGFSFTQILSTTNNVRNIEIFNGNLYFTTASGTNRGLYQVGTGLPTTTGQTATLIVSNNLTLSSPYNFSISQDGCTIYLTDDGNGNGGADISVRGIHKWQKINGVWTFQYKYTAFARGLVVDYKEAITKIYATTSISNSVIASELIYITDNGSFSAPVWTLPAGLNYAFAGIDFTPNSTSTIANPITTQPIASASLCNTQTQTLSVTTLGSPTYQWYSNTVNSICGATPISGAVNATYTPPATGIDGIVYYFVKVSVNCSQIFFSNISAITTVINPTPTATNNSPICVGGTLTLATPTVLNATYSWTGPNSFSSSTQNPTVSTNATSVHAGIYSVTTTVSGCTSPAGTTNVVVNQNPSINALSPP